jgi:chromosome partitioning protein
VSYPLRPVANPIPTPFRVGARAARRIVLSVARILAVANQKGGVAKTTTVVNLAAALVEGGSRVLVVDLDAQACATFSLGLDPEDLERTGADAFMAREPALPLAGLITTTDDGVDLLPAAIDLAGADRALASVIGREYVVRDALAPVLDAYDWILLDCSPSLGIITINALTAADEVLIPLQCETLSHRGVGQLMETIADVQRLTNPRLRIAGVLPTLFDGRTTHARAVLADLGPRYGVRVFSPISRSIRFAEAPAAGRSILATSRSSKGANDYRTLAAELTEMPTP